VHVGDNMTSVLLGEPTRLCMTRGRVVWFVCSDWGPVAVVHEASGWRRSVSSLRTAVSTADRVTGVVEVFWKPGRISALGALANPRRELFDVIEDLASLGHLGEDFLLRVHHCGVVAAEGLPDLGQRQVGQFAT
jgi:hypothetical protein